MYTMYVIKYPVRARDGSDKVTDLYDDVCM